MNVIYKVTQRVERPHAGHMKVGALHVEMMDIKTLVQMLAVEHANRWPGLVTIKIEQTEIGNWTDVTDEYLGGAE